MTRRDSAVRAEVAQAVAYLQASHRWAAISHPGFAEYAADLARLHARLERATGRHRAAVKAGAECFECGGQLERRVDRDGLEEDHVTCRDCGETYDARQYAWALKAAAEAASRWTDTDGQEWATPAALAHDGLREATIRSWRQREQVRGVLKERVLFVHVGDVRSREQEREAC